MSESKPDHIKASGRPKALARRIVQVRREENGRDCKGRPQIVYCINEKMRNRVTLPSVSRFFP
nr:hypothetical protein [uncultured Cohaesibacter sp.]